MNKAIYLTIVFFLPMSLAVAPREHFGFSWLKLYTPFAVVYILIAWFIPTQALLRIVVVTPLAFALYVVTVYTVMAVANSGISASLKVFAMVSLAAIPISIGVGSVFVLLAYRLHQLFFKQG